MPVKQQACPPLAISSAPLIPFLCLQYYTLTRHTKGQQETKREAKKAGKRERETRHSLSSESLQASFSSHAVAAMMHCAIHCKLARERERSKRGGHKDDGYRDDGGPLMRAASEGERETAN